MSERTAAPVAPSENANKPAPEPATDTGAVPLATLPIEPVAPAPAAPAAVAEAPTKAPSEAEASPAPVRSDDGAPSYVARAARRVAKWWSSPIFPN